MKRPAVTVHVEDCLVMLAKLDDDSVDAIVTDPPYGLGFMGKEWDSLPPGLPWAQECLRVLKPGGHLLAFGGTRTWHRLAVAVEDAGFEMRDSIAWLYGSGFPKSLDVSKAIDAYELTGKTNSRGLKEANKQRPDGGPNPYANRGKSGPFNREQLIAAGDKTEATEQMFHQQRRTAPATPAAQQWHGWGTALKPAFEPIVVARKPLEGTVAANVLAHGTGALNIDGCRVPGAPVPEVPRGKFLSGNNNRTTVGRNGEMSEAHAAGRWPANVLLDGSQADALDQQSGTLTSGSRYFPTFRYQAKAPTRERVKVDGIAHPTVKPVELMRWLVRLITPPGGLVLDPFAGSGTTGEACVLEGVDCVLIERAPEYVPLIRARLERAGLVENEGGMEAQYVPADVRDLGDV